MTKTYEKNKLTIDQMLSKASDAKAKGHTHYFTGKPCKRGHIAPRVINGRYCQECARLRSAKYYKPHPRKLLTPEEKIARKKAYYKANKDKIREQQREYSLKNKDHIKAVRQKYWLKKKKEKAESE